MLPYLSLLFLITISNLFDGKKIDKFIFICLSIWMLILSAFRVGGTGTGDYEAYLQFYYLTDTFDKVITPVIHAEIGFRFLSFLGNYWGFEGQFIIIAMATLAFLPVSYVIYKYSPYKILSLIIWMPYFLTMNMHSSRISVAAAFGLLFIVCCYNKNWFRAIISLLLAVSFHFSALILIFVFLAKVKFEKLLYILVLSLMSMVITSPFNLMIFLFNSLGLSRLSGFVQIYIESEDYGYPMAIYDPRILLGVGIIILIFKCQKQISNYSNMYFFKIYIIGVMIMIIFSNVVIMAWRLSYLFILIGVLVIPYLSKIYNYEIQKQFGLKRGMSLIFIFVYFLYTLPIILNSEPYEFF